jgi:hypothetical protein
MRCRPANATMADGEVRSLVGRLHALDANIVQATELLKFDMSHF